VIVAAETADLRRRVCDRLSERVSVAHFRRFGDAWLSSIGVSLDTFVSDEAPPLPRCLELGLNTIDAGLPGSPAREALARSLATSPQLRGATFVVVRGGVVDTAGSRTLGERLEYLATELVRPEVIAWEDVIHDTCIAGRYLAREVAQTREALGVRTIDAYLLERPHVVLQRRPAAERERRLAEAMEALEREVAAGTIGCYGIGLDKAFKPVLALDAALAAARRVAGDGHRLRIVGLPASLGALDPRPGHAARQAVATAQAAAERGLYVVTACAELRDLVAIPAELRNEFPGLDGDDDRLVQMCRSAPGVGTTLAAPADAAELEQLGRIARVPPSSEATAVLLTDDGSVGDR
jgi:hypothetical protein